jgi:type I restriction enzyme S subunit
MSWPTAPLGDVAELLNGDRGKNYPSPAFRVEHGIPFVNAGHLVDGHIRFDDMDYITEEHFSRLGGGKVRDRDILLCIRGSLGRVAIAGPGDVPAAIASSLMILRPKPAIDAAFLLFFLSSSAGQAMVAARDNGAAQPNVGARDVAELRVPLPPLSTQRKIAAILSAYDDLIENNRRRIALLEQMAQAIYREWFVHFRYPGHEDDEFVDSPLGRIPAGWHVRPVEELAAVVRGRSYRKHELVEEGGVPFINLKCMQRGGGFRRDGLKRYAGPFKPEQVTSAGDIVLAVTDLTQAREILARATLVPRLSEEYGVISLDVVRLVPRNSEDRIPLFAVLRYSDLAVRVKEHANGSTVLHLSPDHVAAASIIWPAERVRRRAADLLGSMYSLCDELSDATDRLASIRDLLQPKLVTGAIDVSKLNLDGLGEESGV